MYDRGPLAQDEVGIVGLPNGSDVADIEFSISRSVYRVDPLRDPRWKQFIAKDQRSSIFHTPEWLDALRRTYGYVPVVLTTSPPDVPLRNGIALCSVSSWLTGERLVSLPFSDHCELLVNDSRRCAPSCDHLSTISALRTRST
jgi:hypothetical protein